MREFISARSFRVFAFSVVCALGLQAAPEVLAAQTPTEYEVKAVMLFNLARFVEWPATAFANSNAPIVIGVLGRNPFGEVLEQAVEGETVNGRRIVIQYYSTSGDLKPCHILFICSNEKGRVSFILSKLKGQPTLTVSEIDNFSKVPGGMVRFYTNEQNKIRLRINLSSARSEGLSISSKLIQVAELEKTSLLWPLPRTPDFLLQARHAPGSFSNMAR